MIHALDTFPSFFMMVVDSEDLRALVAYLSVVLFFTTRPSEDEDFWFLGTKVPADSNPGVAVSPILIHSTLHRYGKALLKPWFCSYSLGKAVLPCSTRRSLALFSFWPCSSLLPHARPPATKNPERSPHSACAYLLGCAPFLRVDARRRHLRV